jgi:glycerophosphoryl diester phosphodiesterase
VRKGQIGYPDETEARMHTRNPTQIMAHRGASVAAPANTVAAFVLARDMGAHAVELDVRQCATGELVVHHDPHLADGRLIIHLAKPHLPAHIPTLDEALDACGDMWVNVEVKNHRTEPDYDADDRRTLAVLGVLRRRVTQHGDTRRYLLSCFRRTTVDRVHAEWPALPTAWLTVFVRDARELARDLRASGHSAVHPEVSRVSREMIEILHSEGLAVNTWTCDDPARMRELIDWGVDGICTNVPDVGLRVLGATA